MLFPSVKSSLKFLIIFTVLLGAAYPFAIYFAGQIFFPDKANGSLFIQDGKIKGSYLIAQEFKDDKYFHPRPSAINYNPLPSGASNLSETSALLLKEYERRKKIFIQENSLSDPVKLPDEMLFASASGVDPDISKESAYLQTKRITNARNFNKLQGRQLLSLIDSVAEPPQFGVIGNEVVNVLKLNIKLDEMSK